MKALRQMGLVMVCGLALAFVACGSSKQPAPPAEEAPAVETTAPAPVEEVAPAPEAGTETSAAPAAEAPATAPASTPAK